MAAFSFRRDVALSESQKCSTADDGDDIINPVLSKMRSIWASLIPFRKLSFGDVGCSAAQIPLSAKCKEHFETLYFCSHWIGYPPELADMQRNLKRLLTIQTDDNLISGTPFEAKKVTLDLI